MDPYTLRISQLKHALKQRGLSER